MKIARTPEALNYLKECTTKMMHICYKLKSKYASYDNQFELLWNLAFITLRDLEKYRIPETNPEKHKENKMVNLEKFDQLREYMDKDLVMGIGIAENQVESTIVFYSRHDSEIVHAIQTATNIVQVFRRKLIRMHIDILLEKLREWEHEFCIKDLGNDEYDFFDFVDGCLGG